MKGQSAFELLSTYGWVLATVVTLASLLVYLNYTDPADFLEEDCKVDGEFVCLDYALTEGEDNSTVFLALRNRNYEPIKPESAVAVEFEDNISKRNISKYAEPGEIFEIYVAGKKQNWKTGQKRKINFKIVYYTNISTPTIPKVANGHVYAEVK